jgi:hypothetical protein
MEKAPGSAGDDYAYRFLRVLMNSRAHGAARVAVNIALFWGKTPVIEGPF